MLATSHISPEEGLALIAEGASIGISRFLITHASHHGVGYTFEQKRRAIELGAYIEETVITWEPAMSLFHYRPIDAQKDIFDAIVELGPEHFCLGTDCGFWATPSPADAYRSFIRSPSRERSDARPSAADDSGQPPLACYAWMSQTRGVR